MRILLVKTSSLGDVIHALPALTDAGKQDPNIKFDWVVEQAFAEVPRWHPLVDRIIPVALRRWRKQPWRAWRSGEWAKFYSELRQEKYDLVIDAQGLVKSGFITWLSRGVHCGYDRHSAWEPLACLAYQRKYAVAPEQHAITRIRQLFAQCLQYPVPLDTPDYGLNIANFAQLSITQPYLVSLHGTTRVDKCWPETSWTQLINLIRETPYKILLPWGNNVEKQRAERLAFAQTHVTVLAKSSLTELAALLAHAKAVVAVDTGLGHLSAALNTPTISLYGATDPALIGTAGKNQIHLSAKSMEEISAEEVCKKIKKFTQ